MFEVLVGWGPTWLLEYPQQSSLPSWPLSAPQPPQPPAQKAYKAHATDTDFMRTRNVGAGHGSRKDTRINSLCLLQGSEEGCGCITSLCTECNPCPRTCQHVRTVLDLCIVCTPLTGSHHAITSSLCNVISQCSSLAMTSRGSHIAPKDFRLLLPYRKFRQTR